MFDLTSTISDPSSATATDAAGTYDADATQAVDIVPSAPTGLEVSWASSTSATLTWTNSSALSTTVSIQYSTDNGSTWSTLATGVSGASYTATSLTPSNAYLFSLNANNSTSGGGSSSAVAMQPYDMSESDLDGTWTSYIGQNGVGTQLGGTDANVVTGDDSALSMTNIYGTTIIATVSGSSVTVPSTYSPWPDGTLVSGDQMINWANNTYWVRDTGVPTVGISTSTTSVNEGDSFTATASWSGGAPGTWVTVPLDFSGGTAVEGTDFTMESSFSFLSGTANSMPLNITTTNDGTPGWTKAIDIAIGSSSDYTTDMSHSNVEVGISNINLGITLGDGSSGLILEGDGSGTDQADFTKLYLNAPKQLLTGATVTLSTTAMNVDVWDPTDKTLLISPTQSSYEWIYGGPDSQAPDYVLVGVTGGSASVGDIQFELADSDVGIAIGATSIVGSTHPIPPTTQPATGVTAQLFYVDTTGTKVSSTNITNVTGNNDPKVIVGQHIGLVAEIQGPATFKTWNSENDWIKDYLHVDTAGGVGKVEPLQKADLTNHAIGFFFSDGSATGMAQTVSFDYVVNGQTNSVTIKGEMNVYEPTASIQGIEFPPLMLTPTKEITQLTIDRTKFNVPKPFSGHTVWVQVINNDFWIESKMDGVYAMDWSGLDNSFPYGKDSDEPENKTLDTPGLQFGNSGIPTMSTVVDSFSMYLMFIPDGQFASYVPLAVLNWGVTFTITNQNNKWVIISSNPEQTKQGQVTKPLTINGQTTSDFPTWTNVVLESDLGSSHLKKIPFPYL